MIITDQFTDMAGKLRCMCQMSNGVAVMLKFKEQPTQQWLDDFEAKYLYDHQYDEIPQIPLTIDNHFELIKEFIIHVKNHPTLTITQYNNYLSTKQWWEAAIIRFFVFKLAVELSNRNDVTFADYTESKVLLKLRNWIIATTSRKIAKIVLGFVNEI